ncbi:guanine deaminase [Yokenella regensburgei]|uniref:Guanine deaminase n=1 Tax=Yokenella regensburgei TaxID=158877 RepID=A0ABX9RVA6_9ENTR|nr:guanine deaminase [Yokenella regensburgei]RKR53867.1 guanine deaminase [Yokenella regensburgei]VFS30025.1 Guanine deaminase [Yokenella regensburgei]
MSGEHNLKAVRGSFLDVTRTVEHPEEIESALRFTEDGLMLIREGKVEWIGEWETGKEMVPPCVRVRDYRGKLVVPGFVDTHIHYPQSEMVGAYGEQLLEWLNKHTFPTERRYADLEYAREMSSFFLKQLLRNGTTTALVFGTVHPESVDALFEAASHINMRMIAGKVMMDRNAPDYLLDTVESSYQQSKALIERWHNHGRLQYAITPRFAPTSTPEQLAVAHRLREEYPDTWVHTHLCENVDEIAWVKALFPEHDGYLDVYHQFGLTGRKSVFAHCVHLEEKEWDCLRDTRSSIAFCPTSNLYLGSGLFNLQKAWHKKVAVGMGTDIGAGTTFNMLQTLNEAYKVMQLQGARLSAFEAFYLATLGGAHSLDLDHCIGNFNIGKEADFVVLEPTATPLQQLRYDNSVSLIDKLFVMMTLGDDRSIYRTYVDGRLVYERT